MEEDQEGQSLQRYLEVFSRWWWLFVLLPLVMGSLAYLYSKSSESTVYHASSLIQIQEQRGAIGEVGRSNTLANTYKRLMTTSPLLGAVATDLKETLGRAVSVGELRDMVSVSSVSDTPLLKIEAKSDDPDLSVAVANTLPNVFQQDVRRKRLTAVAELQALAESRDVELGQQVLEAEFSGLRGVTIEEPAILASSSIEPSIWRNTLLGIALGIFLGGIVTLILELFNRSIRSAEQIERMFGSLNMKSSVIGVIYRWRVKEVRDNQIVMLSDPHSMYSEMFRQVRTSFQFAAGPNACKVFMVTSATPQEGKTTVIANLGVALAQGGDRVVLVEGDLRRPSFHRMFSFNREGISDGHLGLSTLLANGTDQLELGLTDVGIPGLKILPGGEIPSNPADLLGSERMPQIIDALKESYDYILVDSPPILAAADPMILASQVEGVILVATIGESRSDDFRHAVQQIQRSDTPLLGYVLNKMRPRSFGYGQYHYRYYNYYASGKDTSSDGQSGRASSRHLGRIPLWSAVRRRLRGSSRDH